MKTLPVTLYKVHSDGSAPKATDDFVGFDPEDSVYGLMAYGRLSHCSYRVSDLVTEERIEEMLTDGAPFAFFVDSTSRLCITARTFLETLRTFGLIGPQYDERIADLPRHLASEAPPVSLSEVIAGLTKELDDAKLDLEAALQHVEREVEKVRRNTSSDARFYTARKLTSSAADAAELAERCRKLSHKIRMKTRLLESVEG